MFPSRFYPDRMFAPRYFPKVGDGGTVVAGHYIVADLAVFTPGITYSATRATSEVFNPGIFDAGIFNPGASDKEVWS
jgi:hypothetical protein